MHLDDVTGGCPIIGYMNALVRDPNTMRQACAPCMRLAAPFWSAA